VTVDFSTRAQHRRLRPLDAALIGFSLLACILSAIATWSASDAQSRTEASLGAARRGLQDDERRMRAMTGRRKSEREQITERAALTFAAPPARVLADLEQAIPSGARLDGIVLHYGEALDVEVTVVALAPGIYDHFLERFEATRRFTDLEFGTENRSGQMKATVRGRYRDEEAP
jgi:hypothetical protein